MTTTWRAMFGVLLAAAAATSGSRAQTASPPAPVGSTAGAPAGPAAAPHFTPEQAEALRRLAAFYRRRHQATPGNTAQNLGDTLEAWTKERVKTENVKIGERAVKTPTGTRMEPIMELREIKSPPRIRVERFPDTENDAGTNAEYDSELGTLQISPNVVEGVNSVARISPVGEGAIPRLVLAIEYAQTIVHEFIHVSQPRNPGSPANEALAYRGALNATHDWLAAFEKDYAASRTKENARQVWAAAKVWLEYKMTIEQHIKSGKSAASALEDREFIDAEIKRLEDRVEQMTREHRAIELLQGMTGTSPLPGVAPTLDELLAKVQARDPAELEARLNDAAGKSARAGRGPLRANPAHATQKGLDNAAQALVASALPLVRQAWERKLAKAAAAARRLREMSLEVSVPGLEVPFDPRQGKAVVRAQIANDREFAQRVGELGRALQTATGDPSALTVTERWRASEVAQPPRVWRVGVGTTFELSEPKPYEIHCQRSVRTRLNLPRLGIPATIELSSMDVVDVVAAESPEHALLAGVWGGTFVINELPFLEVAVDPTTGEDADACQLPMIQLGPALKRIKDQPMKLSVTLQPRTETMGEAELRITPPEGLGAAGSEPKRFSYTYQDGKLSIDVIAHKDARLRMSAAVVRGPKELTFEGRWQLLGEMNGRQVLALAGMWSGRKSLP